MGLVKSTERELPRDFLVEGNMIPADGAPFQTTGSSLPGTINIF
jgi:hypothetical protein